MDGKIAGSGFQDVMSTPTASPPRGGAALDPRSRLLDVEVAGERARFDGVERRISNAVHQSRRTGVVTARSA